MFKRIAYIFVFFLSSIILYSQSKDDKKVFTRVVAGPAISFINNNNFHTANTRAGYAFYAGVFEDIKLYKNIYFLPGLEYMYNKFMFNSYYLGNGYQTLYNKQFDYNYNLNMQEGRLNLLLRITDGQELRNAYTFYGEAGYVLRYIINTQMKVTSNNTGTEMFNSSIHPAFEHPVATNNMSSGIKINIGIQHNYFRTHRAWFIQLGFMYGLSRFLIQESFTPASLYIKSSFLQVGMGVRF